VHCDPNFQIKSKVIRQYADKIGIPLRDGGLTYPDPESRSDRSKLGEVTIGAKCEIVASQLKTQSLQGADRCRFPIEAYQHMLRQLRHIAGLPTATSSTRARRSKARTPMSSMRPWRHRALF
jgi:hypothetical protein